MEDPKYSQSEEVEQDSPRKREIVKRLLAIDVVSEVSEMEDGGSTNKPKSVDGAPQSLPFFRTDALTIDINSNPNAEIVCNFGKLGERSVHVLVAIAYAYANGDLNESEATSLHFKVLHTLIAQFEGSPRKNLLEARLLRVESLAKAIKVMRPKPHLGETSELKDYHIDAILGSTESLKEADALDPAPTKVSDTRAKTRRLIIASGIAGLVMGIGAAIGATYPEKIQALEKSMGSAIKSTSDWVSKKLEEVK